MIFKRGQVTIFILIAVILISIVLMLFVFKDSLFDESIPQNINPIYTSFLSCLEEDSLVGIDILESQAGYIFLPEFEPGSSHMPFSSQLSFLGNPIPYWYYVSGNNVQKEQIPSKKYMETQLAEFIESRIRECNFDSYYESGFGIDVGEPEIEVDIREELVEVDLDVELVIEKEEEKTIIKNHNLIVKSQLGALYNSAKKIYEQEQEELFLEEYAVDILRLYAPVDGVELTCSPKIWSADAIFDELQEAIEENTAALKIKGGDYSLKNKEDEYFVMDLDVGAGVRFINSRNWSNSFEVNPSDESILIVNPIGNQPGLGILGFCYVPYHFVYNVKYPVLIQVYKGQEIFQFPMAVVLQGNNPRESLDTSAVGFELPELCEHKNTLINVNTYDVRLNPIEADIFYRCFGTTCSIGKTSSTETINHLFPQCVNGYVVAKAEGFEDTEYLYTTMESGNIDMILDKLYEMEIKLKLAGRDYNGDAIINFISDTSSKTIMYPNQKSVKLSEAQYEIQVSIYKNSSLKLSETIKEQCMEVPSSGLGGLLGFTKKKCFEVKIPPQIISNVLAGGGKENYYVIESELANSNIIEINSGSLPLPKSIEQLQDNYLLFENKDLDVYFK